MSLKQLKESGSIRIYCRFIILYYDLTKEYGRCSMEYNEIIKSPNIEKNLSFCLDGFKDTDLKYLDFLYYVDLSENGIRPTLIKHYEEKRKKLVRRVAVKIVNFSG